MQKKIFLRLSLFLVFFFVACSSENEDPPIDMSNSITSEVIFHGTIEEITDETSAVVAVNSGDILNSADKVIVDLTKSADDIVFEVGNNVQVTYDGIVRESYPAQINTLHIEKIE
ncbi:MAG TPA: hypothetical protein VK048_02400 [Atopostipes sp.]|nr:hypothetical protein [Atopostipes sp.]